MTTLRSRVWILLMWWTIQATCSPMPSGVLSWWQAEGNATDSIDGTSGALENGTTFGFGKVGVAFSFDGVDDTLSFGNTIGNFGSNNFTIEFWIRTTNTQPVLSVLGKREACVFSSYFDIFLGNGAAGIDGVLFAALTQDATQANRNVIVSTTKLNDGEFHHVALVRESATAWLYIDGTLESKNSTHGVTFINNAANLVVGRSPCVGVNNLTLPFQGELDELTIYNRALSAAEVAGIYEAGSAGKGPIEVPDCLPPVITVHPKHVTAKEGNSAHLSVAVEHSPGIQYQWLKDSQQIPDATNASLMFDPVQPQDAGIYCVVVGNDCRSINSLSALLQVNCSPIADASLTRPRVVSACGTNASVVLNATASSHPNKVPTTFLWKDASGATFADGLIAVAPLPLGLNAITLVADDGMATARASITVEALSLAEALHRLITETEDASISALKRPLLRLPLQLAADRVNEGRPMQAAVHLRSFLRRTRELVEPDIPSLATRWIEDTEAVIVAIKTCWCGSRALDSMRDLIRSSDLPENWQHQLTTQLLAAAQYEAANRQDLLCTQLSEFVDTLNALPTESDPELSIVLLECARTIIDVNAVALTRQYTLRPSGMIDYEFRGLEDQTYVVEISGDGEHWIPVGVAAQEDEGRYVFHDQDGGRYPTRYYRTVTP